MRFKQIRLDFKITEVKNYPFAARVVSDSQPDGVELVDSTGFLWK